MIGYSILSETDVYYYKVFYAISIYLFGTEWLLVEHYHTSMVDSEQDWDTPL